MIDEDALRLYDNHWSKYKSICRVLNAIGNYVNRYWVTPQYHSGATNIIKIDLVRHF
jgi:hypothetical protein